MGFDFGINTIDHVLCLSLNIKNKKIIYVGRDGNGMTPSRPATKILSRPALSRPENFRDGISRPKMTGNGTGPAGTGFFEHPYFQILPELSSSIGRTLGGGRSESTLSWTCIV